MKVLHSVVFVLLCFLVGFLWAEPDPDCFRNRPKITPMECCPLPDLIDQDIMQQCRDEFNANSNEAELDPPPPPPPAGNPDGGHRRPHRDHRGHHKCWSCFTCAGECAFNATGLMKDGELDAEKALEHFVQVITESDAKWPRETVEDAFSACNDKVKVMREKFAKRGGRVPPPSSDEGPVCSPIPQHLIRCMHGQLYRACPTDVRTPSDECTELQDYLNRCHGPLEWKKGQKPTPAPAE
uniref:Putative odorant-binding protein 49a n=1 Tax=Lutzomyia longipalpis TaxID=7200 RepID=A0A1B0CT05_LUTLO